jgi:alkaline phosphatase D
MGNFCTKRKANIHQSYIFYVLVLFFFIFVSVPYADSAVLTHGPVVGGVTANKAKIFVRTDVSATVAIEYSTDPNFQTSLMTKTFQTTSLTNFTDIIPLSVLNPQATYYLNIHVNGIPQFSSNHPSFKTFPATTDPQIFKFIILTDFKAQARATESFSTFSHASQEGADFIFIGGDFDHSNPMTLSQKRQMFKRLYDPNSLGLSDFVNGILRRMPIVHHWDDHDAGKNNLDKTYPYWSLSYRAFKEYVPTYGLPPSASFGIWQYFQYAHIDFFVLDGRSQRDPDADPDDTNKSMLDGNNLGASGQLEWLKQGLLNSTSRWKIIFTSVVTNPTTKRNDSWGAFQTEWGILRNFIRDNQISGVVFISGDLHIGGIDNGTASGFPEMVVPPSNSPLAGSGMCLTSISPGSWSEGAYYSDYGPCNGYGVVTVLTSPDRLLLEIKDQDGNIRLSYTIY